MRRVAPSPSKLETPGGRLLDHPASEALVAVVEGRELAGRDPGIRGAVEGDIERTIVVLLEGTPFKPLAVPDPYL